MQNIAFFLVLNKLKELNVGTNLTLFLSEIDRVDLVNSISLVTYLRHHDESVRIFCLCVYAHSHSEDEHYREYFFHFLINLNDLLFTLRIYTPLESEPTFTGLPFQDFRLTTFSPPML